MARVKIAIPSAFSFSTFIPVRITDVNYGGHVGNDAILGLIHEARMQFLKHYGYTEMNVAGASLIMSDAVIEFKGELFYGDALKAYVTAGDFTRAGFDLFYQLVKVVNEKETIVAVAKTGMVCYNYQTKKVTSVPAGVLQTFLP